MAFLSRLSTGFFRRGVQAVTLRTSPAHGGRGYHGPFVLGSVGFVAIGGCAALFLGPNEAATADACDALSPNKHATSNAPLFERTNPLALSGGDSVSDGVALGQNGGILQSFRKLFAIPPLSSLALFSSSGSALPGFHRSKDAFDDPDLELERALQEAFGAPPPRPASPQQPPPIRRRAGYVINEAGRKLMWTIIGINAAVWGAFQVPQLQPTMMRWFLGGARSLEQGARGMVQMFLSTYGHVGLMHLGFNMMAFHSFAPLLMDGKSSVYTPLLSTAEFFTFYTAAGVAGSLASAAFFRRIRNYTPSLGASGSIFGIATYFCLMHPQAGLTVMFVLPMSAQTGLLAGTGVNLYLVARAIQASRVGNTGPMIDGMAHLGGQAVGFLWFYKRRAEEMMKLKQAAGASGGGSGSGGGYGAPPAPPSASAASKRSGGIDI